MADTKVRLTPMKQYRSDGWGLDRADGDGKVLGNIPGHLGTD